MADSRVLGNASHQIVVVLGVQGINKQPAAEYRLLPKLIKLEEAAFMSRC